MALNEEIEWVAYKIKNSLWDVINQTRWAYQRVVRGWDDRAIWSVDYFITGNLIPILEAFKSSGYLGIPIEVYAKYNPEYHLGVQSDWADEQAVQEWKGIIDKIIEGFKAAKRLQDDIYVDKEDYRKEVNTFKEGMHLFTEYFFDLWD